MSKEIQVAPYDPNWPHIYEKEAALIWQALSGNCLAIHHIGSTAVPGLAAKPKIDMIAVVKDGEISIPQLEKAGFAYKGEWNIPFKFGFTKRGQDEINLHVFEEGHPEIELNILFRDHLRSNPQSLKEYAQIKETLIEDEASFQKQKGSMFSGYNLGKDRFIRQILKTSGYNGHRFLKVTHIQEWEDYHRIRKTEIFDPIGVVYDPHHPSITANGAYHFILCHGIEVRTVAHIEFLSESDAALRSLATDAKFQRQGYGAEMMFLLEKWLKRQNIKVLKMHSRLSAEPFYRKLGFAEMPFDDPSIQEQYIDLGKAL